MAPECEAKKGRKKKIANYLEGEKFALVERLRIQQE